MKRNKQLFESLKYIEEKENLGFWRRHKVAGYIIFFAIFFTAWFMVIKYAGPVGKVYQSPEEQTENRD